jgi:hypothetical protein
MKHLFFTKYYNDVQINEDEKILVDQHEENGQLGDLRVDRRMILKW